MITVDIMNMNMITEICWGTDSYLFRQRVVCRTLTAQILTYFSIDTSAKSNKDCDGLSLLIIRNNNVYMAVNIRRYNLWFLEEDYFEHSPKYPMGHG